MGALQMRPYQQAAREAIHAEWNDGRRRTLLVLPTGTGKTIVFAAVTEDQVRSGSRVLVLAHRGELLEQAADKIKRSTGLASAVEKAEQTCLDSWCRVVVGSVQSLQRPARLEQFPADYFGTIIIDEAHHAITDGYQRVLEHFPEANVLGVTATPDRGDMRNLGEVFDSLAYEYKLTQAIREGYLCPILAQTIPLQLDISQVALSGGDFAVGGLGTALDPYLEQIASEMQTACAGRKTVVFLPLIKTSQKFRDILNSKGFRAAEVNGQSEDRAEILSDFSNGKYNVPVSYTHLDVYKRQRLSSRQRLKVYAQIVTINCIRTPNKRWLNVEVLRNLPHRETAPHFFHQLCKWDALQRSRFVCPVFSLFFHQIRAIGHIKSAGIKMPFFVYQCRDFFPLVFNFAIINSYKAFNIRNSFSAFHRTWKYCYSLHL